MHRDLPSARSLLLAAFLSVEKMGRSHTARSWLICSSQQPFEDLLCTRNCPWYFWGPTMCQKVPMVLLSTCCVSETACDTYENLCVRSCPWYYVLDTSHGTFEKLQCDWCCLEHFQDHNVCHTVQGILEKLPWAKHGGACLQSSAPETEIRESIYLRPTLAIYWVPGYSRSYRMRLGGAGVSNVPATI